MVGKRKGSRSFRPPKNALLQGLKGVKVIRRKRGIKERNLEGGAESPLILFSGEACVARTRERSAAGGEDLPRARSRRKKTARGEDVGGRMRVRRGGERNEKKARSKTPLKGGKCGV